MADLSLLQFNLVSETSSHSPDPDVSEHVTAEHIRRLSMVWEAAIQVWKTEEATADFLRRRHPMLRDQTPIDVMLQSDEGARSVCEILGRLRFGSAA